MDLRQWREDVSQENPGTLFNEYSKHSRNLRVRPEGSSKAGSQEKFLSITNEEPYRTETGVQLE